MFFKLKASVSKYLFIWLTLLTIILSLAGYFGRYNLYFEFVSGYKLQFLVLASCSLIYFIFTRIKLWIIISLCCVLLNLAEILPWYLNRPQVTEVENYRPLKVISYNVLWDNQNYGRAISLINSEQPDIAIFQEALPPWNRELANLKTDLPYHIAAKKLEIEIYSKLPLKNTEIKLYGTYRGLVISDLTLGNRQIKFVATHAYSQLYYGKKGWQIRNDHLEKGIGEYSKNLNQSVIIIGDLNVTMRSPFYRLLIERSGLHNARQGFGILPSQSGIVPQFAILSAPIDHCLVSPDIKVKNFKLGRAIGWDRVPIIIDLFVPKV